MKKYLFAFLFSGMAASALFTSCSNDDDMGDAPVSVSETDPCVKFSVNTRGTLGTRGTATTAANYLNQINNFQVWGYFTGTASGEGVVPGNRYVGTSDVVGTVIDGDGTGNWSYHTATDTQYWPATTAPLNFQAVTPASDASFTIENTPADNLARVTAVVTVPTAVTEQKDIMFAKANAQVSTTNDKLVSLTFNHAMSQVVFAGKLASDKIAVTVSSIELVNIFDHGKVGYFGTDAALTSSTTGTASSTFSVGLATDKSVTSTTAKNLTADDGALIMLPQTVTAWTTTAGTPVTTSAANTAHHAYLKIRCTIVSAGVTLVNNDYVYLPFSVNWQQGKKYTYTLLFGAGSGGFDADGNPIDKMLPITYTVASADNWTAVDGGNVSF